MLVFELVFLGFSFLSTVMVTHLYRACLAVLVVPAKVVTCLELLSTVLVTGDTEGALHLWSMDDYTRLRKLQAPGHRNSIISMQASGSKIVSGSSDGIKEWDLDSGELVRQLADSSVVWQVRYTRGTIAAAFVQDGNLILKVSHKQFTTKLIMIFFNIMCRFGRRLI